MNQGQLLRVLVAGDEELASHVADAQTVGDTRGEEQALLRVDAQLDTCSFTRAVGGHTQHRETVTQLEDVEVSR
ncbi:hypothetical protein [Blastococcus sp. SYSU DS0541]